MSYSSSSRDGWGTSSDEDSSEPTLVCDTRIAFDESVPDEDNMVVKTPRVWGTMGNLAMQSNFSGATRALKNFKMNDNTAPWMKESDGGVSTTREEYDVGKPEVPKKKCEQFSFIGSGKEINPATKPDLKSDSSCLKMESTGKEISFKGDGSSISSTSKEAKIMALNKLENRLASNEIHDFKIHEKELMRNFKVLMKDVILNEEKTNVFLDFFKIWLEKRLTRRGWVTKLHPEIKAICSKLQKKRNGVEKNISKLRNIGTQISKTVIGADAQWAISQHTVSNLYAKMIVLWNEFIAISNWPSHKQMETEKAFKEQLVWCERHSQLGNDLGKLEDEYSTFANLIKYGKEEIAALNKSLEIADVMVVKDIKNSSDNEKLRKKYDDEQELFRKKLKVCADERFDVITRQEEMSEEFDVVNIDYAENLNRTQKTGLQLECLAVDARKLNNVYLNRLIKQVPLIEHYMLRIQSGDFDMSDDNKRKLIFRLKQAKQFLEDVIVQGSDNQKAIDNRYNILRSSSLDGKHLSYSTDVNSRKVTLNDRACLLEKILSLESDRRKIIALSRKLDEERDILYRELIELGLINKSLDTEQQYEPTATLINGKLDAAFTELEQTNRDIEAHHNDSSKLLDRCKDIKNKTKIADDRGNDNRKAIRKYEAEIKMADMEEMKRLSLEAFDEIKFELRKYNRATRKLDLIRKRICQMREPRFGVQDSYANPEEKLSHLLNLLMKSQQRIPKLIEDCLQQLTVSKSETERLKVWVREHGIKNIGICELELNFSTPDVEPKTGIKNIFTKPEMNEHIKILQKMPDEKDDLTLRNKPKISDNQEGSNQLMETKLRNEKGLLLSNLKQQIEIICSKRRNLPSRPVEKVQVLESKVKSFELEIRDAKMNCLNETYSNSKLLMHKTQSKYSESNIGVAHQKNMKDDEHLA